MKIGVTYSSWTDYDGNAKSVAAFFSKSLFPTPLYLAYYSNMTVWSAEIKAHDSSVHTVVYTCANSSLVTNFVVKHLQTSVPGVMQVLIVVIHYLLRPLI
jgi:hypothetical protein